MMGHVRKSVYLTVVRVTGLGHHRMAESSHEHQGPAAVLAQHPSPYVSYLKWRVINGTTAAEVTSCQWYNGDKQINNLPAGDYALELTTEQDKYGTYNLRTSYVLP